MLITWNKHKMYNGIKLILTSVPLLYCILTLFLLVMLERAVWMLIFVHLGWGRKKMNVFLNYVYKKGYRRRVRITTRIFKFFTFAGHLLNFKLINNHAPNQNN